MRLPLIAVIFAFFGHSLAASLGADLHPWDPQPRDANWLKRHEALVEFTKQHAKDEEVVFIGDSITEGWAGDGKNVWNKYYTPRKAFDYGIGGDRTEHVIYRIANNEFDGIKAKVAVLMIGTNNLASNTIEDIAHGVKEILTRLAAKMPTTKVILLGVLPRGEPLGAKAKQLNVLIEKFADNKNVFWLDMWNAFADTDGKLKAGLYKPDNLHLVEKGYEAWRMALEPLLNKLDPMMTIDNHPWVPQPRDANWLKRHDALVEFTKQHGKEVQVVFLGDSITEGWGGNGANVWTKHYTPLHAHDYGIGGDRTEHVLYRIDNKEFDGVTPKVTVLMIGTNNLGANTVEDIAHGVKEILARLAVKMPTSKVILLGVLPRAEPYGTKAKQLNVLLEKLADGKNVHWLDMWLAFADANGREKAGLFTTDTVHLVEKGYEVWQETMEPLLKKLDPTL